MSIYHVWANTDKHPWYGFKGGPWSIDEVYYKSADKAREWAKKAEERGFTVHTETLPDDCGYASLDTEV